MWQKALRPSWVSPRATVTSSAVVRTVSSVPSTPTAVVTPPEREPAERERRDPGLRAGLAAAAGEVDVPVDQAGDDPAPAEVHFLDAERAVERRDVTPDPDHPLAGHQQVAATLRRGVVQLRVPEQQQHRTVRAAHSSLNPPTAPVSRSAASARWVALDEISSVEALSCCAAAAISSAAAA